MSHFSNLTKVKSLTSNSPIYKSNLCIRQILLLIVKLTALIDDN